MSNSAAYSRSADLTHKQAKPGPGMNVDLMFMCGTLRNPHKGKATGAIFRGRVPWKCAACVEKAK